MPDAVSLDLENDVASIPDEKFFTKGMVITLSTIFFIFLVTASYLLYLNASPEKRQQVQTLITRISPTNIPKTKVRQVIITPTEVPEWNTFTDTNDAFVISYPRDWSKRICPIDAGCSKTDTATYFLSSERIGSGSESLAYTVWVQHWLNPDHKSFKDLVGGGLHQSLQKDFHYQTETVNGVNRIRTRSLPVPYGAEFVFFPQKDGSFFSIAMTPFSKENPFPKQNEYETLFENIVSSLQIH